MCEDPAKMPHATYVMTSNRYLSKLKIICDIGWEIIEEELEIVCDKNGDWDPAPDKQWCKREWDFQFIFDKMKTTKEWEKLPFWSDIFLSYHTRGSSEYRF